MSENLKENKKIEEETVYEEENGEEFIGETGESEMEKLYSQIKKLKEKLRECTIEKQNYLRGWQRAQADFINYRRRQEEQLEEWRKLFNEKLIFDILPVLDSLEAHAKYSLTNAMVKNNKGHNEMVVIHKQLKDILHKHGVEEIKAEGERFNPEFHEAIEQVESDKKEGMVIEEVQKGYMLNGKVIRTAKVKVARAKTNCFKNFN